MKICLLSSILPVQLLHHSGKIPSFQSLFYKCIIFRKVTTSAEVLQHGGEFPESRLYFDAN